MIIDMHAHTSNFELNSLHTKFATLDVIEDFAKTHGVERVYLMCTYFPLKKTGINNLPMLERVGSRKLFGIFGSLNFEDPLEPSKNELRDLATRGLIEGIKLYPGYQDVSLADPRMAEICQIANDYNLPVAIHTGHLHHCCETHHLVEDHWCGYRECPLNKRMEYANGELLGDLAANFPNVRFVAAHMANPRFDELLTIMKIHPNIHTDISGLMLSGGREDTPEHKVQVKKQVERFIKECGIERIMFATDFPIQSYADTIGLVESLNLTADDKDMIYYKNAKKFLKG